MRILSAATAAGGIGIGLAAAWVWPPLAVIAVWPFLLVVPGWALVGWGCRDRARIPATGRLGLAVILSVAVSAHLAWWLAILVDGYGRETVFAVAVLLAIPVPLAAWRASSRPVSAGVWFGSAVNRVARVCRRHPAGVLLAMGTAAFVFGVLALGLWRVHPGGVDVGGANWSDLGVHLSIAQSVNAGNFPPDVPYYAGEPLVYHWFADFHAAMLASAAGLFAVPVFVVHSALLAGAVALLVHGLALVLVRDRTARRTAALATLLVVLGGGLGWMRLMGDLATGRDTAWNLIATHGYDNQWLTEWPYFRIPSVMTTGLLVHRATAAGLPMLVGAALLVLAGLPHARRRRIGYRDHPRLILLAGVAGALLASFHFFFFPIVPLLVLGWVVLAGRLLDRRAPGHALLFLVPYVLAIPFAAPAFRQAAGSGWLRLVPGWESAPFGDGPAAVLFFYATNLGVPFVLAIVALALRQTPSRAFLALWVGALFLIPNLVQVSFVGFDMNKYFQAMWIAVAVLAGWLLARWPRRALVGVLVVSLASPLLAAAHTAISRNGLLDADQLAAVTWIANETPERSVFVTDDWIISPTDPAGRLRLTSFAPYLVNLGYDPAQRLAQVHQIRCGGSATASAVLMRDLGADYVIQTGGPGCEAPVDFAASDEFEEVYANPSVRIFRLSAPP